MPARLDHLELTVPRGTLTVEFRRDVDAFYCGVFGWTSREHIVTAPQAHVDGTRGHMLRPDDDQFIFIIETDQAMTSAGEVVDFVAHLGVQFDSIDSADEAFRRCAQLQAKDDRLKLVDYGVVETSSGTSRNFLVNYLLPFWFDVHALEPRPSP